MNFLFNFILKIKTLLYYRSAKKEGVFVDLKIGSRKILFAFGGLSQKPGIPLFEFFKVTKPLKYDVVFFSRYGRGVVSEWN